MKTAIVSLLALSLLCFGCAKTATVTTPGSNPSPNAGLIDATEAVQVACEVAAPLAGAIGPLISAACPPLVTGILNVIESSGTLAQIKAAVAAFGAEVAAIPGASGNKLIADIQAGANGIVAIYAAATGQTVAPASSTDRADLILVGATKLHLSASEKARIKALRARAAKLAAKK